MIDYLEPLRRLGWNVCPRCGEHYYGVLRECRCTREMVTGETIVITTDGTNPGRIKAARDDYLESVQKYMKGYWS